MLILLPPSEGKTAPRRSRPVDLAALAFPDLSGARGRVLDALVGLCRDDPGTAARTLGLGPAQRDLVDRNAALRAAPTARADAVYSGVLYDALDLAGLSPAGRRRAATRLLVTSALFGLLRPADRVPAYRLSGDATLPDVGPVAAHWRAALAPVLDPLARDRLVVDLRSTAYAGFWRPAPGARVVTVRVLHEVAGRRQVVSHFNKATKGRLVRDLLEDGRTARTPRRLAGLLGDLGWSVEEHAGPRGAALDVVVSEL